MIPNILQVEPYYWEEGGNPNVDWWAKVRHSLHFGGVKAVAGAEAIGEVSDVLTRPKSLYIARVGRWAYEISVSIAYEQRAQADSNFVPTTGISRTAVV